MIDLPELDWESDASAFWLQGLRFVEVQKPSLNPRDTPGENCFGIHRLKQLIDEYQDFFKSNSQDLQVDNMVELGLFEGGSVPFWLELLGPGKYLGIDVLPAPEAPYLDSYLRECGLGERVELHWSTDQADSGRLAAITDRAFAEKKLDLVIDDASHLYDATLSSFEVLFPRLRPGGLYIIEDWAWFHWEGIEKDWAGREPLSRLIFEIVEAVGSTGSRALDGVEVRRGFAVVRRGQGALGADFHLRDHIYRHPRTESARVDRGQER